MANPPRSQRNQRRRGPRNASLVGVLGGESGGRTCVSTTRPRYTRVCRCGTRGSLELRLWWALRGSNPRPSPCKGEEEVLV